MKYRVNFNHIFIFGLFILYLISCTCIAAEQFDLKAYTAEDGRVVLIWQAVEGVSVYDVYRKEDGEQTYSLIPGNISMITECAAITQLIPEGSLEHELIKGVFEIQMKKSKAEEKAREERLSFMESAERKDKLERYVPFNLCEKINSITPDSDVLKELQKLAPKNWKIAVLLGQGYEDQLAVKNTRYTYKVCIAQSQTECDLETITAGEPVLPAAPDEIHVQEGDNEVLIYWQMDTVPLKAVGFKIYRKEVSPGNCEALVEEVIVNKSTYINSISYGLDDEPIAGCYQIESDGKITPLCFGFSDFLRFDPSGAPLIHQVNGEEIFGPQNGKTYCYRVSSVDLLANEGAKSWYVTATPEDKTLPMSPQDVMVIPHEQDDSIEIRWSKVLKDVTGHIDEIIGYNVYRYDTESVQELTQGIKINGTTLILQPSDEATIFVTEIDDNPNLRSPCGTKIHYYRVESVDSNDNTSIYSEPAVQGSLKDITPPQVPQNLSAESGETTISLSWDLNTDCDIEGYVIYRSFCAFGSLAGREPEYIPFEQIGYVFHSDAVKKKSGGVPLFIDSGIDKASPLCYAYLIKSQDKSQNMSGAPYKPGMGIVNPTNEEMSQIVCARLKDTTPPQPPVISGLSAKDNGILIEWVGAPVQDIKAYHIYRSEKEDDKYTWVGGMEVLLYQAQNMTTQAELKPLKSPYKMQVTGCDEIPLELNEKMSIGSFLDEKNINPKMIYWYKVAAVDQAGNETKLEDTVAISTFTFSTSQPSAPTVISVSAESSPCGLRIEWTPKFDSTKHLGFAVFRSRQEEKFYFQLNSLVEGNSYLDTEVVEGVEYWYRIMELTIDGKTSLPSKAVSGIIEE